MDLITFEHGGQEYDCKYPDGIPTSLVITTHAGEVFDSGLIMYPCGHARNKESNLEDVLKAKFKMHGEIAMDNCDEIIKRCMNLGGVDAMGLKAIWDVEVADRPVYKD